MLYFFHYNSDTHASVLTKLSISDCIYFIFMSMIYTNIAGKN